MHEVGKVESLPETIVSLESDEAAVDDNKREDKRRSAKGWHGCSAKRRQRRKSHVIPA